VYLGKTNFSTENHQQINKYTNIKEKKKKKTFKAYEEIRAMLLISWVNLFLCALLETLFNFVKQEKG
jgi:hypothetical protein